MWLSCVVALRLRSVAPLLHKLVHDAVYQGKKKEVFRAVRVNVNVLDPSGVWGQPKSCTFIINL